MTFSWTTDANVIELEGTYDNYTFPANSTAVTSARVKDGEELELGESKTYLLINANNTLIQPIFNFTYAAPVAVVVNTTTTGA
jgi:hypothetical protein